MLNNKIKMIFTSKGIKQVDYANKKNISKSQLGNKIRNSAFSLKDLIELCDYAGASIKIIDNDTGDQIVKFDINDIKKES